VREVSVPHVPLRNLTTKEILVLVPRMRPTLRDSSVLDTRVMAVFAAMSFSRIRSNECRHRPDRRTGFALIVVPLAADAARLQICLDKDAFLTDALREPD
jgi:hypothetical protein